MNETINIETGIQKAVFLSGFMTIFADTR